MYTKKQIKYMNYTVIYICKYDTNKINIILS